MFWRRNGNGGRRGGDAATKRGFRWNEALDEAVARGRSRRRTPSGAVRATGGRDPDATMRIVAFVSGTHPSSHYRGLHPLAELMRRGHEVALHLDERELAVGDGEIAALAEDFDVAFIVRYKERHAWQLARRLTAAGLPVVWDYDDDVHMPEELRRVRSMLSSVTVVTTTSNALAAKYRKRGARCIVPVPNYLSAPSLEADRQPQNGVVIGYIGWIDHQQDWDGLRLTSIVGDLLARHRRLSVESVGPIDLRLPAGRYRKFDVLPFELLPQAIARLDVAIAPLLNKPGNATRSDIKLKEYAILGVPWLASPFGPYRGFGEEQGGRLVPNRSWSAALDELVSDDELRRDLGRRGAAWARDQTLERNGEAWEEAFRMAIQRAESA